VLGWIAGTVLGIRRAHVAQAMRVAGIHDAPQAARAMFRSLGTSALEFLCMAARGPDANRHVRLDGPSQLRWEQARGQGRGVIVAASHTGNWDLAACAVARDVELLVITKRLRVASLDVFWQSTRAAQGLRLVEARGALKLARSVLARGGVVAMMIDQVPSSPRHAIEAEFLGRTALVDRAPAALAASCGCPLVVAASRRDQDGEHVLMVLDVIDVTSRPTRAWVASATRAATRALERFVRDYPSQWLWLHRRWKRLDPMPAKATLGAPCLQGPLRSSSPATSFRAA
jgi:KDO2-lipid IV(A) lauroyltransferase